jgi:hypothetical protein
MEKMRNALNIIVRKPELLVAVGNKRMKKGISY